MPKESKTFTATVNLNIEKGGGWLASVSITSATGTDTQLTTAWKNASAAKRWVKERVKELTPRKSIKLIESAKKDDKPISFVGSLDYRE